MKWQVDFRQWRQCSVLSDFACSIPILKDKWRIATTAAGAYLDRVHRAGVAAPVPPVRLRLSRPGGYTAGEFVR
ncbi:hypothetical protein GCM10023235_54500 [Kitasatospora terrestris]|uniref:Uncharacterized protein n=1 Tax=Kitasatospora terrestris TaxID=258051 RepID=A0ABP9E5T4_9ACTN